MDPTGSRIAISTSSNAIGGGDSSSSERPLSPHSPIPATAPFNHNRRRSYVSDTLDVWPADANGDITRTENNGASRSGSINNGIRTSSAVDGIMSPRIGAGEFGPKLSRISDADDEGLADDEETGLTEAARKRRQQRRQKASELDEQIVSSDLLPAINPPDATVIRRSMINVGLIGMWYFFSLSISIYNKWMFGKDHLDFRFPLFTTSTHMLVQFTLASLVLYLFPRFRPQAQLGGELVAAPPGFRGLFSVLTRWFYVSRLGPCGIATGLDIGLGNMSLKFISLTFFTMCKSSALAFVLLFAFVFRLETPSIKLVLIIATMTVGVVMMVFGEVNFDLLGFILIITSSFFSGFRWAMTQILLLRHPATSNPFASIFFLAPIMFASMFVLAVPIETFPALATGMADLVAKKGIVVGPLLLLFPGLLAFCMTSAEYALLQRTSVVTLSICGIFKEVVTISAAEIVYHDPLTPINLSGLLITICSIGGYNYIKVQKMRRDAKGEATVPASSSPTPGLEDEEERRGMLADALELENDEAEWGADTDRRGELVR